MSGFRFLAAAFAMLLFVQAADATSTKWWIVDTAQELLEGRGYDWLCAAPSFINNASRLSFIEESFARRAHRRLS